MTKREKRLKKIQNNSNNCSYSEIKAILSDFGFEFIRIKGSHFHFTRKDISIVIPVHHNKVNKFYIKDIIKTLTQEKNE